MLHRHARCVFSRLRCNGHSLLLSSYVSRIGRTENPFCSACGHSRPRIPLISFCTVQLRTLCAAHSLATLCLSTTSGPDSGELPGFWGSMIFRQASISPKGSGNNKNEIFCAPYAIELVFRSAWDFSILLHRACLLEALRLSWVTCPWTQ